MRHLARIVAAVCAVAAVVVGIAPNPSSATEPQATGWWSRVVPLTGEVEGQSRTAAVPYTPAQELPTDPPLPVDTTVPGGGPVTTIPLPVPTPTIPETPITIPDPGLPGAPNPTVPDGGLWVANDPTGPAAISALRYRGDVGTAELTLTFAPGSTTVGRIIACPALSDFQPGPNGAWGDRPAHDCDRIAITGRLLSDATGVQFTIPQSFVPFGERVLDIIVLPDPTVGDPFSLYFQPPDANSLEVTAGQDLPPFAPDLPDPDPGSLPASLPDTGTSDFGGGSGGFTPTDSNTGSATTSSGGNESASGAIPEPIAELFEPFTESRTARIISVALLLLMGGSLWYFGGAPVRPPQRRGGGAGAAPVIVDQPTDTGRGIGRFRRDRVALPNRL